MIKDSEINLLEKKIRGKMSAIGRNEISMKESKIGYFFNKLKDLDEALYLELIIDYKEIIQKIDKK
ncbi:hypothetical protein M0Q97_07060 [Candidatus Dojkabacteria bacterium]|jgi:hypothetical protein|nr:hypothetical protein [Candidatus Dojkabacteria bacterium]